MNGMAIQSANTTNVQGTNIVVGNAAAVPTTGDSALNTTTTSTNTTSDQGVWTDNGYESVNDGATTDTTTTDTTTEDTTKQNSLLTATQTAGDILANGGNVGLDGATNILNDPNSFLTPDMKLANSVPSIDASNGNLDANADKYQVDAGGLNVGVVTPTAGVMDSSQIPTNDGAATYDAAMTQDSVNGALGTAARGEVRDEALVNAEQIDMKGTATGYNADGTVNYTGQALTQFASQNISTVIDTSTVAGKLLAQQLGEGNYIDAKATALGQLEIISKQFQGPNGEPKIPSWAQGTARNVARIAAFKGMTGTAATAAMSTAIMEATLPIAQSESQFYQTLTIKNLDNRQEATINRANVLAKMDQLNLDARMSAAITNSKNFMEMDLQNLSNEQQMAVINTQARVQSILEDAKATNTQRMFTAEATNDMEKFYDELSANITKFNIQQVNEMNKFNAGEINSAAKFNADLENNREQFYREMQYNIDVANAKWRQTVTLTETEMAFNAAQTDVQNMFNISVEAQNQLWDRADAILDYTWKSEETALDREARLEEARLGASATKKAGTMSAVGSVAGAVAGAIIM
jgi:hypothetical protein